MIVITLITNRNVKVILIIFIAIIEIMTMIITVTIIATQITDNHKTATPS